MADDPLDNAPAPALADPLDGWQPGSSAPPADTNQPPQKSILETAFRQVPSATTKGDPWAADDTIQRLRGAFGEGYGAVAQPSVTREGTRSIFTPETQRAMEGSGWLGRAGNVAGDIIGTGAADVAGAANSVYTLGNETLRSLGLPAPLLRDLNVEATQAPFAPELRPAAVQGFKPTYTDRGYAEMARPPAPSLPELLQRQRAAPSDDPVTNAAISLLRRSTQSTDVPPPPAPFTTIAPPQPPGSPSGGLLNIPPASGAAPTMTADEMLARSQGYYNPADKQAAQGAMISSNAADGVRGVLTEGVPTDPQKAAAIGNTPLVQLGKDYQAFQGQPMSFDTAMALDRRLTSEIQSAVRSGNNDLARQLGQAQDAIRTKVQSLGAGDTTGDPSALANLPQARQAYMQYVKQSQVEDIIYRASLLPEDKQNAYVRNQATSMLRSNKTANWSDAERAVLEQAVKSGNIGTMGNIGISLVKPFAQATGGAAGGSLFGTPGAIVGGQVGGELGTSIQARLRAALSKITLDKVSQQLSQGVPPPAPGQ